MGQNLRGSIRIAVKRGKGRICGQMGRSFRDSGWRIRFKGMGFIGGLMGVGTSVTGTKMNNKAMAST